MTLNNIGSFRKCLRVEYKHQNLQTMYKQSQNIFVLNGLGDSLSFNFNRVLSLKLVMKLVCRSLTLFKISLWIYSGIIRLYTHTPLHINDKSQLHTFAFTSAFLFSSNSTTLKWPRSTAQCNGVLPSLSAINTKQRMWKAVKNCQKECHHR